MNRLPPSPRKMVAGLKLNGKNESNAPAKPTVIKIAGLRWFNIAAPASAIVETNAEPVASPSMPSIRLKALVMNAMNATVIRKLTTIPNCCPK